MKSRNEKYIQALCALHEDDFTKNILKPLFESMGFDRVDFNGGPYERGRDLIAQRRIPPRKEMYVVYVQSKKIGNIQNTSSAAKLSKLIHQLRQCCSGEITDEEGRKISPNEVYLACPEQITNRLIEELETQLFNSPIKVLPYDGPRIIADIKEFKPELLGLLTNIEDKLTSNNNLDPSNKELLSALKSKNYPIPTDFYSDLNFFVGSFDSNLLLHLEIELKDCKLKIAEENWVPLKKDLEKISEKHGFQLIDENIKVIEDIFLKNKTDYESKPNQILKKNLINLSIKVDDISDRIENHLKALNISITPHLNPLLKKLSSKEISEREDIATHLKLLYNGREKSTSTKLNLIKSSFQADADLILSLIQEKNKLDAEKTNTTARIISEPFYEIRINYQVLAKKIESYKKCYFNDISLINKRELSLPKLNKFLFETERTLSLISKLKCDDFMLSKVIHFNHNSNVQDRVSISPHDIFSTGYDIAVYGGAGVGKTTTLKEYADLMMNKGKRNIIYIPLNRLVDQLKKLLKKTTDNDFLEKDLLIKIILLSKGVTPSNENVQNAKKIISSDLTLILDGLDEIYNTIPNIIRAISQFKINNKKSQLIISSRDCVSYLNDIEFLGITLLPFTEVQLNKFIRGWLKDKEKAEALIKSIKHRELFEHVKTPLLATITCSLVEKGINAPSTENEIYSERLRLLTGEYDLHKSIERQKQKGELLRKCAIKIAFTMHNKDVRSLPKGEIFELLCLCLSETYHKQLLADCLEELITPCNVLIMDPITSTYSFGHFRFQEHLASEELKSNRNIDLSELVTKDWWRGVLNLYSQDNNISYLIEDVYKRYGNIKRAKITLESMIANSPHLQRPGLRSLLENYLECDLMEHNFLGDDFSHDNYDNYGDYN